MNLLKTAKSNIKKLSAWFIEYTKISQTTYLMALAIIIGIFGGFGAIGFRLLIAFFQKLALGSSSEVMEPLKSIPWFIKIIIPLCGAIIVGPLVYFFAREAKGHGVPEVMEAVALKNGVIRPRVVLVKSLASAITIGTGGSVGREGPIVQIGSAFASTIGQILKVSPERLKILVGCGAAAGIAATFNAPIAGAFFALEVIIGNFALISFSPIIIASVFATAVSRAFLGDYPAFNVPQYSLVSIWEIPLYMILGIIAGLIAVSFTTSVYKTENLFNKISTPEYVKNAIGGLLIGIIIIFYPNVFGVGYETIDLALSGNILWYSALILIFIKLLATNITLGSGGSGGIFAPSLFLGATTGSVFGQLMNQLFPNVTANSGAYAMVGMGAVVAGTTHAPITSILILFELTSDYKIILPVMIACTIATVLARKLQNDSIYTKKLTLRGISLNQGREEIIMKSFLVGDLMHSDAPMMDERSSLKEIVKVFMNNQQPFFYVVSGNNRLEGYLSTHHVKGILSATESLDQLIIAKDLLVPTTEFVTPDMTLADCMHKFENVETEHLPVIENENNHKLIGIISKKEIIRLYNREILRKEVLGVKFVREFGNEKRHHLLQLPKEFKIDFISVPEKFVGSSIKDVNIRAKYNITILAIKQKLSDFGQSSEMPSPERVFKETDILVVAGKEDEVENFKTL
jgi:chloride channel protein, CIC family